MKIRLKVDISGSRDGKPWPRRGGVVDLPQDEAVHMCRTGMAIPVADDGQVETAVAKAPVETREALTKESAAAVVPSPAKQEDAAPDPAAEAKQEPPKESAPAKRGRPRKTAAAKPEPGEK